MLFGPVPVEEASSAILAHSMKAGGKALKKGRILSPADVALLQAEKVREVTAARLDTDDVHEDAAAAAIAAAVAGTGIEVQAPTTGRCYLYAATDGLLVLDVDRIHALNRLSAEITLATLPPFAPVRAGQVLATVKIIPFAVSRRRLDAATAAVPLLRVSAFAGLRIGLIQTRLPETRDSMLDKTVGVLEQRFQPLAACLAAEQRCPHESAALAQAIAAALIERPELLLIVGASAIVDTRDVVPAAVRAAGGQVLHLGMPVDPGNMILLGALGATTVLGLPGCARSPSRNGLDLVLARLAAGVPVTPDDIMGMGVGGLLK